MNHFPLIAFAAEAEIVEKKESKLKVLIVFAHPDEGEIYAGGITALYSQSSS